MINEVTSIRIPAVLVACCLLLSACFLVEDDKGETISGIIVAFEGSAVDSDVNDPFAPYSSNDTPSQAQALPNPVTLGGYVNRPFESDPGTQSPEKGRSYASGDVNDYFKISLLQNQIINLQISDFRSNNSNNLDLFLLDGESFATLESSTSGSALESIVVPQTGHYVVRVHAVSGYSKYVLTIGLNSNVFSTNELDPDLDLNANFVPGEVIVKFKSSASSAEVSRNVQSTELPLGLVKKGGDIRRNSLYKIDYPQLNTTFRALGVEKRLVSEDITRQRKFETLQIIKALRKRSDILSATPNYIYFPTVVPNDPDYYLQWHYPLIDLPQAWEVTTGQSTGVNTNDVVVGVIDTGVLVNHPDLQGQLLRDSSNQIVGYDFVVNFDSNDNTRDGDGMDPDPNDPGSGDIGSTDFHGTHVAGTIAAATDNNRGVAGVAWKAKIMPLRALGPFGGTEYAIEQAIRYAAALPNDSGTVPVRRADIINLSLGGPLGASRDPANIPEAFQLAHEEGVIIIAAAGNENSSALYYPAAFDGVVGVAAINIKKEKASYSNFGSAIDIAAPGGEIGDFNGDGFQDGIYSLGGTISPTGITYMTKLSSGTSMAAPHVAGVAALMKAVFPQMTPDDFDDFIASGQITEDLGATGRDNLFGYGLINASAAVSAASFGAAPELPPFAIVFPQALNFSLNRNSISLTIRNGGDGLLDVVSVAQNAESNSWLNITPPLDANGLGEYTVTINRENLNLTFASHTAEIFITTLAKEVDEQNFNIPVFVTTDTSLTNNAGVQYVILQDLSQPEYNNEQKIIKYKTVKAARVMADNGVYSFRITGIKHGSYWLSAGSDNDNNDKICETGESCGSYPSLEGRKIIYLGNSKVNTEAGVGSYVEIHPDSLENIRFDTGFSFLRTNGTEFSKILAPNH